MNSAKAIKAVFVIGNIKATANTKREIALNALQRGLSIELTADLTGLSLQEVQQLQEHSPQPSPNSP